MTTVSNPVADAAIGIKGEPTRAIPSLKKDFKVSLCSSLMCVLSCWITTKKEKASQ